MTVQERALAAASDFLFDRPGGDELFNPYHDHSASVDRVGAAEIRRSNLANYFGSCVDRPRLFLLAEAPGPWGCRFSGVPITSESQLVDPDFPISGRQSSLKKEPYKEYSAGIFWRLMTDVFPDFVVWNACPCHPHKAGEPFTIRAPRQTELRSFAPLVAELIDIFQPKDVLAVGRKAQRTLADTGVEATYVRHPSQGGATAFRTGVLEVLSEGGLADG
jgi:Uracil DNA glycosylase superfamily